MKLLTILTTALLLAVSLPAQTAPKTLKENVSTKSAVQCSNQQLSGKSAEVFSPSGARAFVSVSAKSLKPDLRDENKSHCTVTWAVHIGRAKEKMRAVTALERDGLWFEENSFELIGWSRDGSRLLAASVTAAGDADETTPVIYDVVSRKLYVVPLGSLFNKIAPKDCPVYFRPMGFTPAGHIVVSVGAFETPYLEPGQKPCFAESLWEVDYVSKRVTGALKTVKPEHFGTMLQRTQPSR